jgi:hypothetical protein
MDARASLDGLEKRKFLPPPGLELRPLGRPVRRQSLYRLRYPGSYYPEGLKKIMTKFNQDSRCPGRNWSGIHVERATSRPTCSVRFCNAKPISKSSG